ncbi:type II toxin-antitoxin system RelE/ParE family toxin, partial [Arthrospira platensis SPKY1]|nr:type II toxin-antitoxin system RelE/ParE family toxin [Arthrospira platensis SPKY1]
MKLWLSFDLQVESDVQSAIDYYDLQVVGLGRRFREHLDDAFNHLASNPYFALRYATVRCYPLRKFPYMIHYSLHEGSGIL